MRQYQLRNYYLTTREAATDYILRWQPHIASLQIAGVETHGFFSHAEEPLRVTALVSFEKNADSERVIQEYMQSREFRDDMAGFDMALISRVETVLMVPGAGSPLS